MVATLLLLGLLTASYIVYAAASARGPRGASIPGICYGVAGYLLMLYAALLGMRKKVPTWRIGRAQTWMRGHLWLGFLTLPLILLHCAFSWKGSLATVLMALLFITVFSGVVGAGIQHLIPAFMTRAIPMETIYEEIPNVRRQLCMEADVLATSIFESSEAEETLQIEIEPETRARFVEIYTHAIRPALMSPDSGRRPSRTTNLASAFDSLRKLLPAGVHPAIDDLENICEEEGQLRRQRLIHIWLHGWLLLHVPLSVALIVLGAVHAVVALRY